jgi:serine/threonine protein kinase
MLGQSYQNVGDENSTRQLLCAQMDLCSVVEKDMRDFVDVLRKISVSRPTLFIGPSGCSVETETSYSFSTPIRAHSPNRLKMAESSCTREEFFNTYREISELGTGSTGPVTKAVDLNNEMVAIKMFYADDRIDAEQFALIILQGHPNVIRLLRRYRIVDTGCRYFVFELCACKLTDRIKQLTRVEIKQIFRELMDVVAYCHSKDIVHGDIHDDNIMFRSDGKRDVLKLIDFGCANTTQNACRRPQNH